MHSQDNKKIKISIRSQFALTFASLTITAIVFFLLVNSAFLDDFYIKNKEVAIKNAYNKIATARDNSELQSEKFDAELDAIALKYNIDVIVIDVDSQTVSEKAKDPDEMRRVIWDRFFVQNGLGIDDKLVEQKDNYQLYITKDKFKNINYIEMYAIMNNDNIVLIRSALESIEESARMTNVFLIGVGALVILIGIVVVFVVTKKVTRPILELADISERMGNLDFDVKYEDTQKNEIGLLGENINKMSETLENTISKLKVANIELQKDIERKEKLEEMRSEFLSAVSHELKTPLAIIKGYAEGLVEGVSSDKESMDYYCSVINDEADKMTGIVMKLLTLNELEAGNDVTMERFDIVTLIENRIHETDILAKQNGIEVIFSANKPIFVWGDEFKAEEVLTNYISNAINYCSGEKKIVISVTKMDKILRITVYNTGDQIPDESLGHLFEKFYKVDKARTRDYGGSGIGLSIVKAIQNSINQGYGVENKEDGVAFWFEMELA